MNLRFTTFNGVLYWMMVNRDQCSLRLTLVARSTLISVGPCSGYIRISLLTISPGCIDESVERHAVWVFVIVAVVMAVAVAVAVVVTIAPSSVLLVVVPASHLLVSRLVRSTAVCTLNEGDHYTRHHK